MIGSSASRPLLDEKRATLSVSIKREPHPYQPGNGNSYYLDLARQALPGLTGHGPACERLERYGRHLASEALLGGPEGRRALRVMETATP